MILLQRENTKLNPMSNRVKKKNPKNNSKKKPLYLTIVLFHGMLYVV